MEVIGRLYHARLKESLELILLGILILSLIKYNNCCFAVLYSIDLLLHLLSKNKL